MEVVVGPLVKPCCFVCGGATHGVLEQEMMEGRSERPWGTLC